MARGNSGRTGQSGAGDAGDAGGEYENPRDFDERTSGSADEVIIGADEANIGVEPGRKRRGRRPGGTGAKKTPLDLKGIEGILYSAHLMLATALKVPEIALSEPEAKGLAVAVHNVARHYPNIQATQQTVDWMALLIVCASVYGSRSAQYKVRKAREKRGPAMVVRPSTFSMPGVDPPPQGTA